MFCAGVALAAVATGGAIAGEVDLRSALRLTGRLAFVLWFLTFVASPTNQLIGSNLSRLLLRQRPRIGLAFAGVQTWHALLILTMFSTVPSFEPAPTVLVGGGIGFVAIAAMTVTSFRRPARAVGRRWWRRIHTAGTWWIAMIFAFDFFRPEPEYLPFAGALAAGFALRAVVRIRARAANVVPAR